jgi:transcriptional antiterminator RfaH
MEQWYTLYTKPNAEYQVAATLQRRGIQIYLPEIETPKAKNGHTRKPFFPCYLFSRIDLKRVGFSQLQWTPGLRRIIAFGGQPVPLPDEAIHFLRSKLDELEIENGMPIAFKPGDSVRIIDGPFRDMLAIFAGPTTPSKRVQVLLNILGRASRIHIKAANLEKTTNNEMAPDMRPRRTRGKGRRIKQN